MNHSFEMFRIPEAKCWLLEISGVYEWGFLAKRNRILRYVRNFMRDNDQNNNYTKATKRDLPLGIPLATTISKPTSEVV